MFINNMYSSVLCKNSMNLWELTGNPSQSIKINLLYMQKCVIIMKYFFKYSFHSNNLHELVSGINLPET